MKTQQKNIRTKYKNNHIVGAGSLLSVFSGFYTKQLIRTASISDMRSISNDWINVGCELEKALK